MRDMIEEINISYLMAVFDYKYPPYETNTTPYLLNKRQVIEKYGLTDEKLRTFKYKYLVRGKKFNEYLFEGRWENERWYEIVIYIHLTDKEIVKDLILTPEVKELYPKLYAYTEERIGNETN